MLEQRRRPGEEQTGPAAGGQGGIFGEGSPNGTVTVSHGLYSEQLPVGNMTVAEIRDRYGDRFDIDPQSQALVDGHAVGESDRVESGQILMFVRAAGEKGSAETTITIAGATIRAVSPEGKSATMPLQEWAEAANGRRMDSGSVILTNGIRLLDSRGSRTIWVHETPPRVYTFKWIASDSPARHGPEARYRNVCIALPYLVVIAIFERDLLSRANECFFRVDPIGSESDELFYPALLNCSKFAPQQGNPLSWICTTTLDRTKLRRYDKGGGRMRAGLGALLQCLLETGFNYSSEEHEESSWFTESTHVDPRIASVENWVEATRDNALFVLDVPWLKTGKTVRQVVDRAFANCGLRSKSAVTAADLARPVFNYRPSVPK
jgi:hypothetical protein